jgi:hypothetical protein
MAIIKGPVNPVISGTTTFPDLKSVQVTAPNRHSVKPSLVLDFANSKTLDPRITFTRGSSATYYDGTTALAEQNIVKYSQEFDNAFWTKVGTTVSANSIAAPDGTTTADTLTENSSLSEHNIYCGITPGIAGAGFYTLSVYAKAGTRSWITLYCAGSWQAFNLSTGTVGTTSASQPATITSVGNGWYRCTVSGYHNVSTQYFQVNIATGDSTGRTYTDGTVTYTGNGTGNVYIWGAQVEYRSSATGYTLTTADYVNNYIPVLKTAGPNQPRFDVDPITQESKGLLIEEQRTNLVSTSEGLTSWAVDGTGSVVIDNSINPRGQFGGWITKYAGYAYNAFGGGGVTSGQTYTYSVYIKKTMYNTTNTGLVSLYSPSTQVLYNFSTGTVSLVTGSPTSYGCQKISDTIARVWMTVTAATTSIGIGAFDAATNSVMLWGLQIEAGAFPTSYIPTAGSTVTRTFDYAVISGTNFSNFFNNIAGTVYVEAMAGLNTASGGNAFVYLVDSAQGAQNDLYLDIDSGNARFYAWDKGSAVTTINLSTVTAGTSYKIAGAYKLNDYAASKNGNAVVTDTNATVPAGLSQMIIGRDIFNALSPNTTIKKIAYYPVRLTNTELVGMTTA